MGNHWGKLGKCVAEKPRNAVAGMARTNDLGGGEWPEMDSCDNAKLA